MGDEYKKRVSEALLKYNNRLLKETKSTGRKNGKPEAEVAVACMKWMRAQGWSVQAVESKAVWNPKAGRYLNAPISRGTSDCFGVDVHGYALFIEFKAKDRRSTLKEHQRQFLLEKIGVGAFAVCVDRVERLSEYYSCWTKLRKADRKQDAINYLTSLLEK